MPELTSQEADKQLFNAYKTWAKAAPPVNDGNPALGCDIIQRGVYVSLKRKWEGSFGGGTIHRNVAKSVSGGGYGGSNVFHFRAVWGRYKFIWHFRIVD